MKNKRVILISLDAISSTEFNALIEYPNFNQLISKGSYCNSVESIYPSLTFPAHASIVTGCSPNKHGIFNNYIFNPFDLKGKWFHYEKDLKVPALWDYFYNNELDVLSLSWPVSAGGKIKYSLPEMTPAKPKIWNEEMYNEQKELWFNYGTKEVAEFAIESIEEFSEAWFFGKQPDLDLAMINLLKQSLHKYIANLTLFHIYGLDDAKHVYGTESKEVKAFYPIYDDLIGYLIDYVDKENKVGNSTVLMVTGDHSQKNIKKTVYLNEYLKDTNHCTTENNKLLDWSILFHSGDGMGYFYRNPDKNNVDIKELEIITYLKNNPGISNVFMPNDLEKLGNNNDSIFAVEAKEGYSFSDDFTNEELSEHYIGHKCDMAVHGYLPTLKDYQTLFFSYGDSIENKKIEKMKLIDIAPTICKLFNIKAESMDGKSIF